MQKKLKIVNSYLEQINEQMYYKYIRKISNLSILSLKMEQIDD